jgi:hypothetical protein
MFELTKDVLLEEKKLKSYIKDNISDPWIGTSLEGYRALDAKQKGVYGEFYASIMFKAMGKIVGERSSNGHDYIIDGHKTEIKFSVAQTDNETKTIIPDKFMLNHVGVEKDWDRLVFIGINPDFSDRRVFWFNKPDIVECVKLGFLKKQSSGEGGDNDDYMCGSKSLMLMFQTTYAKTLDQW